jgi:predicted SprT family Zn-dependent metalloprotease
MCNFDNKLKQNIMMEIMNKKTNLISDINAIANDLFKIDWVIEDNIINLEKRNWNFDFNNKKKSLGSCNIIQKKISVSKLFIETNSHFDFWVDIIKHEIAHAIDYEIRGTSDHSLPWKKIAKQIGCTDNVIASKIKSNPIKGKYTLKCDICSYQIEIFRLRKKQSACYNCCNKHNYGLFSKEFILSQIKNY